MLAGWKSYLKKVVEYVDQHSNYLALPTVMNEWINFCWIINEWVNGLKKKKT